MQIRDFLLDIDTEKNKCYYIMQKKRVWWNGRHVGLRSQCFGVWVQVPPLAPKRNSRISGFFFLYFSLFSFLSVLLMRLFPEKR